MYTVFCAFTYCSWAVLRVCICVGIQIRFTFSNLSRHAAACAFVPRAVAEVARCITEHGRRLSLLSPPPLPRHFIPTDGHDSSALPLHSTVTGRRTGVSRQGVSRGGRVNRRTSHAHSRSRRARLCIYRTYIVARYTATHSSSTYCSCSPRAKPDSHTGVL